MLSGVQKVSVHGSLMGLYFISIAEQTSKNSQPNNYLELSSCGKIISQVSAVNEWNFFSTRRLTSCLQANMLFSFYYIIRYECFKNKKNGQKTKEKQRNDVSDIFTSEDMENILYPGCSFVWKMRVVYFSVKHSYLCNKSLYSMV